MTRSKFDRKHSNKTRHDKVSFGNVLLSLFLLFLIVVLIIIALFYSYIEIAVDSYK